MKRNFLLSVAIVLLGLVSAGCTGFGPAGGIFTDHKIGVYGTSPKGSKTGRACATHILGLVATGDGSVAEAASKAGITKVNNINLESYSILFFFGQLCAVVQGD